MKQVEALFPRMNSTDFKEMTTQFFLRDGGINPYHLAENFIPRETILRVYRLGLTPKQAQLLTFLILGVFTNNSDELNCEIFGDDYYSIRKILKLLETKKLVKIIQTHRRKKPNVKVLVDNFYLLSDQQSYLLDKKSSKTTDSVLLLDKISSKHPDFVQQDTLLDKKSTKHHDSIQENCIENDKLIQNESNSSQKTAIKSDGPPLILYNNIIYNNIIKYLEYNKTLSNTQELLSSTKILMRDPETGHALNENNSNLDPEKPAALEHEELNSSSEDKPLGLSLPTFDFEFDITPVVPKDSSPSAVQEEIPVKARRGLSGKVQYAAEQIENMRQDFEPQDLGLVDELLDNLKLLRVTKTISITIERNWITLLHAAYTAYFNYNGISYQIPRTGWREAVRQYIGVVANKKIENENYLKKIMMGKACNQANETEIKEPPPAFRPAKNIGYTSRDEWEEYMREMGVEID